MNRVRTNLTRKRDYVGYVQIRTNRLPRLPYAIRFIRLESVQSITVLMRINCNSTNPQLRCAAKNSNRYLRPVGNQKFPETQHVFTSASAKAIPVTILNAQKTTARMFFCLPGTMKPAELPKLLPPIPISHHLSFRLAQFESPRFFRDYPGNPDQINVAPATETQDTAINPDNPSH